MNIIATIFARAGSKGLPGKNIKLLNGKPLIAWAIEQSLAIPRIDRVIVSTDSNEIAEISLKYGAEVPFLRPKKLATDKSPEWLSWQHLLNYLRENEGQLPDIMISVPTTSPLRIPDDIENCIDEYLKPNTDVVITVSEARRNPYFNMVKKKEKGYFELVAELPSSISRRQDSPVVYDMTTIVYALRPTFVLKHNSIFDGKVRAIVIPGERAIDIDTEFDFELADYLMSKTQ